LKKLDEEYVTSLKDWVRNHVNNWGVCDSLSSKILSEMIRKDKKFADMIYLWKDDENIWVKRACCVTFVKIARDGNCGDMIIDIALTCLKNKERFVQLGIGWMLRELSTVNSERVIEFIKNNYNDFIREGLRYAIEKFDEDTRTELLNLGKKRRNTSNIKKNSTKKRKLNKKKKKSSEESSSES